MFTVCEDTEVTNSQKEQRQSNVSTVAGLEFSSAPLLNGFWQENGISKSKEDSILLTLAVSNLNVDQWDWEARCPTQG